MAGVAIRLHRAAAEEFWSAVRWYKERSPRAAQRFRAEFKRVAKRIAADPDAGIVYRRVYRWMLLRRFPYVVYYRVIDPSLVVIFAVAHGRRRPGYWLGRGKG